MITRSFTDFKKQFTPEYLKNVKTPQSVLLQEFKTDATTYDDILQYLNPVLSTDGTSLTCSIQQIETNTSIQNVETQPFVMPLTPDAISTYYYDSDNLDIHYIGVNLNPDFTSVIINKPFSDTTITKTDVVKMGITPSINLQYSSFNEYLILPKRGINETFYLKEFATDIYKQANDTTNTEYNYLYEFNLFPPAALINLNKNLKLNINFDSSLLGVKNSNSFQYSVNKKYQPNHTNVSLEMIDSYYEYENEYKLNGQILIDSNISEYYGNHNLNLDSTIIIHSENYRINRAHIPPMRYLTSGDFDISNNNKVYLPTITFNDTNGFRHVKINHENHSQFSDVTNIKSLLNYQTNKTNSEFIIEFSGYSEVIEL